MRATILFFALILSIHAFSQEAIIRVRQFGTRPVWGVLFQAEYSYDVKIKLFDGKGKLLMSNKLHSAGFQKPYNLSNLPDGDYRFYVEYSDTRIEKGITVEGNNVEGGYIAQRREKVPKAPKVAKEKTKKGKDKESLGDRVLITEVDDKVKLELKDRGIESISVFFYMGDTEDYEYFYWEPVGRFEQSYSLEKYSANQITMEVMGDGQMLAKHEIVKN